MSTPWRACAGGVLVDIRVTPRGGRDAVDGRSSLADGRSALALRVRVPPQDGAANAAIIDLLARTLRLPASRLLLVAGHTARLKTVRIDGDAAAIMAALENLPS